MADSVLLEIPSARSRRPLTARRKCLFAGSVILLLGLVAVAIGLYVGIEVTGRLVSLPAGLPSAEAETVAISASAGGMILMLLSAVVFQRSFDD